MRNAARNDADQPRGRRTRRAYRLTAFTVVMLLTFGAWGPAASAATTWPALSLSGLTSLLTAKPGPRIPDQQRGGAVGLTRAVPPSVTRTRGRTEGQRPGKSQSQLPAYQAHGPAAKPVTTGPDLSAPDFNPRTSKLQSSAMTSTSDLYENANGTFTREVYAGPVNYQTSSGSYTPIDTTLAAGSGGRWQEKGNSLAVSFALRANDSVVASMGVSAGESFGFGLAGAANVAGVVSGSAVTYSNVLPETDLLETGARDGLIESLKLQSASAPSSWIFPLTLTGLTPQLTSGGSVDLVDSAGVTEAVLPAGQAWDAQPGDHTGLSASTVPTTWQLVTYQGGPALQLSLPSGWLTSPATVFPVTVDPSGEQGVTGTSYVQTGASDANNSTANLMLMGTYNGGTDEAYTYVDFGDFGDDLRDYNITAASLHLWDAWAWTCSSDQWFDAYEVTSSWSLTSLTWPGPSTGTEMGSLDAEAPASACTNDTTAPYAPDPDPSIGGWMSMTLFGSVGTGILDTWTLGQDPNYGIALKGPTADNDSEWKQFDGSNSPNPPYLELTYVPDVAPTITSVYPQTNWDATSLTPELQAAGGDSDDWPDTSLAYNFAVYNSGGTMVAGTYTSANPPACGLTQSGWQADPDWTVPEDKLQWGQVYYWVAFDCDGLDEGSSAPIYFTTQVPQPTVTQAAQNGGAQGITPGTPSYTTTVTDAQISGIGPSLSIERDYDSDDFNSDAAFGTGWSSILDMKVSPGLTDADGDASTVVVTYPDGSQVGFGVNYGGTTFTAPQGRYASLSTVSGGGYELLDKNDTEYLFTQSLGSGVYGISSITDALGNKLTFTWNSADEISQMTAASGRSLQINWSPISGATYPHVTSVVTNAVSSSSPALTWGYSYTDDELTRVCPPSSTTACTQYAYTAATPYPTAVLGTGPVNYWRLDDPSGSTSAADSVLANEGSGTGTYTGSPSLGQVSGPLTPYSTATAAGFNGTSVVVTLPPNRLLSSASYQSVSLWFKTTSSGVVYGAAYTTLGGSITGNYDPDLYVGTNGYLYGNFWAQSTSPIASKAVVDNGKWYNAVLVGSGSTQALYLNGVLQGTLSGTINMEKLGDVSIGAGYIGGNWANEPNAGDDGAVDYFNGDISDVAVWNRALTSGEVTGLYSAGTGGSMLSAVTRPSGSVYAQVTYSPTSGAVSQVTDDNGGEWHVSTPTVAGSSQVYVSSVLAQDPADYWRLSDSSGGTAANEVPGGTATYNNATLGESGPFADSTIAEFNGTSSYLSLPSGLVTGAGNQSVSLWFNTTTAGGVLLASSAASLSAGTTTGNYVPLLYVNSNGDLEGEFWNGSATAPIASSAKVDDGKWHNVVLTAGTSGTDSVAMYLDGALVGNLSGTISGTGQSSVYVGAGFIGGGWPDEPNSGATASPWYFKGSISDVAFYNSDLTLAQALEEWDASQNSQGLTPVITQAITHTDGNGNGAQTTSYQMDPLNGDRVIAQTDPTGSTTRFGYDVNGFQDSVLDPDGDLTLTGYDVRGNIVSQTTCQDFATNNCSTAYYTYYPNDTSTTLTPSPENDLMLTARGPGSASASDDTYLTTFNYNSAGELLSETGPAVPGSPGGQTATYTYSTTSTPAYTTTGQQSGTTPAGLLLAQTSPGGAVTSYEYLSDGDVYQVTDPDGMRTVYAYDGLGRETSETEYSSSYPSGLTTTYAYNQMGAVTAETDPTVTDTVGSPHTAQITTTYDADGDVLTQSVADTTGGDASRTVTNTYNSHDQLATSEDAGANTTKYTYDSYGNLASETDPAGNVIDYTYDSDGDLLTQVLANYKGTATGSCQTVAGGLVESVRTYDYAGQLASITNADCDTTAYTYTQNGLVASITRCSDWTGTACGGLTYTEESNTYNAAGQLVSQVTNNGVTTTDYAPDATGRDSSVTLDPAGLDRVTSYAYSPDNAVVDEAVTAAGSSTPAEDTDYTYDPMGNVTSQSVENTTSSSQAPAGWWPLSSPDPGTESYAPDASGNGNTATSAAPVDWSQGGGASFAGTSGQGLSTSGPVVNTGDSFSVSAWADLASANGSYQDVVSQDGTDTSGFELQYSPATGGWGFSRAQSDADDPTWDTATSSGDASAGTWVHLVGVYNSSAGTLTLYVNGVSEGSVTSAGWSATGGTVIGRGLLGSPDNFFDGSIADVQMYSYALSSSQVSTLHGDGRSGGAVGESRDTTSWTLDSRGLPTSMTDPDGNTTSYTYDQAGQLAQAVNPTAAVQTYGSQQPELSAAITNYGYDTFGDKVITEDPNGNETFTAYNGEGQPTTVTGPSYTPPDGSGAITPVSTTAYNDLGEVTSQTDPLNNTTSYAYDQLGDVTGQTAPDGGVTSYAYDQNGDQVSVTSPEPDNTETETGYDFLGRPTSSTLTSTASGAPADTTVYSYGSTGTSPWMTSEKTQDGVTTDYGYDAAGETTSVTNASTNVTKYAYSPTGQPTTVTNPDDTYSTTTYDEAGDAVGEADYSSTGALQRSDSATYDRDGNQLTTTDYRGDTTSYSYNADDELTGEAQPVTASTSVTTSFGYDLDGNSTLYTDGNGNNWWTTYNSWNLPESQIEPTTASAPTATDSTFTTSYNADGGPVEQSQPGGITVTDGYNAMGELTSQAGTGASAATGTRTFGYDDDGDMTSAATPSGSDTFTYNDLDQLASASGQSGSSSFTYNGDGLLSSVQDAAGTTSYTYDDDDRLATLADPVTGDMLTYSYNPDSQVSGISYGAAEDTQTFGYNSVHELTSDTLDTAGGTQVASIDYGYDANGNLTSKQTTGFDGSADNTYIYNEANELTSWDNGTTTTGYSYDNDGNRTEVGSKTYTYDARDELTSDGTNAYSYTMAGTLSSVSGTSGTTNYTSDAFGQSITQGSQSFSYDALGRVISQSGSGSASFSYDGTSTTLNSDGANVYSWDPTGTSLVAEGVVGGGTSSGVLALTDEHTDVTGQFKAGSTELTGSTTYDPLGNVLDTTGMTGDLGYQSAWTDPGDGRVDMNARWYDPAVGQFTSRDTADVSPVPDSAGANPFAYGADNPMTATDPTGHMYAMVQGGGGPSPQRVQSTPTRTAPPQSSCSGFWCAASHLLSDVAHVSDQVYHATVKVIHAATDTVELAAQDMMKYERDALADARAAAGRLEKDLSTGVSDAVHDASHVIGQAWHAAQSATSATVHAVTHYAVQNFQAADHLVHTAVHVVAKAATAVAAFVKNHAAAIASIVVSTVVFIGCDAAIGVATGGVGAIAAAGACGALAGAVGNAVSYGVTAAQTGKFSWSGIGESALEGAATGLVAGGLGAAAAEGASVLGDLGSSLLSSGASEDAAEEATSAAAAGADGDEAAAGSDDAQAATSDAGSAEPGGTAAEDTSSDLADAGADGDDIDPGCDDSFSPATKVLLASGAAIPISQLKPGDKVLATNTKTGKTQAETVKAVIVEHDNDLYDLTVKVHGRTAVIQTTQHHRFWDQTTRRWTFADTLAAGDLLRTSGRAKVSVVSGYVPASATGWMWDLTVASDHDFYIDVATTNTAVLVHNCTSPNQMQQQVRNGQAPRGIDRVDTANPGTDDAQPHIHFNDWRSTLNQDGTWGHGDGSDANLTGRMIRWLLSNGWGVPDE